VICIYKQEGNFEDTFCPKKECVPLCPILEIRLKDMGIHYPRNTDIPEKLVERQMQSANKAC